MSGGGSASAASMPSRPSLAVMTTYPKAFNRYNISSILVGLSSMIRILAGKRSLSVSILCQDQSKAASFSILAFHVDPSTQQFGQLLTQMQAQPGAVTPGFPAGELRKGLE